MNPRSNAVNLANKIIADETCHGDLKDVIILPYPQYVTAINLPTNAPL